ncbi:MAG: hypothetical protein JNK05_39880 [Myxococcales bacterium]|nr:hypothetical protein [Myxococcales bacterium]
MKRRALFSAIALAVGITAGCAPAPTPVSDVDGGDASVTEGGADARLVCPPPSQRVSYVFARLAFVRETMMGSEIADGFNLDNRVSQLGDTRTCRAGDLTSPTGEPGIDNQLARLMPTVDMMTGGAVDGAIQGAINNGQLLVVITISDIDDMCNDDSVTIKVQRVDGMPTVGSDMAVDPGQTFDLQRMTPITELRGSITNRTLLTEPATLPLPVAILDEQFTVKFYDSRMRIRLEQDGADGLGIIGGAISLSEFAEILRNIENIPESLKMQVNSGLTIFADLDRDAMGRCQKISGALRMMVRPAFVLE